jgi:hypothetical protein
MLVGVIDRFPEPHLIKVIRELLCTIETDDVRLTVSDTAMTYRSKGTCQMPVRTVEQQVQNRIDHRIAPFPFSRRAVPIGNLSRRTGSGRVATNGQVFRSLILTLRTRSMHTALGAPFRSRPGTTSRTLR